VELVRLEPVRARQVESSFELLLVLCVQEDDAGMTVGRRAVLDAELEESMSGLERLLGDREITAEEAVRPVLLFGNLGLHNVLHLVR